MPYDSSADTLVCELRLPAVLVLLAAGAVLAAVAAVVYLPLPGWLRVLMGVLVAAYGSASLWSWWYRMPVRLALTGDGRCRGVVAGGELMPLGIVRDALIWYPFVLMTLTGRRKRHLLVTRGMVKEDEFRRLRARLRTLVAP